MNTKTHNCVYMYCENNNRHHKDKSFFKFPTKNVEKTKEWQKNCGNVAIAGMDINELKRKLICEDHFLAKDIMISATSTKRKLLRKNSVPIKYSAVASYNEETPQTGPRCYHKKRKRVLEIGSEEETTLSQMPTENSIQPSTCEDVAPLIKQELKIEMISEEDTKLFQMPTEQDLHPSTYEDIAPLIKQEPEFETISEEDTKSFKIPIEQIVQPPMQEDIAPFIKQEPEYVTVSEDGTKILPTESTYRDIAPQIKQEPKIEINSEEDATLCQMPTDNLTSLSPDELLKLEPTDELSTYPASSVSSPASEESDVSGPISLMIHPAERYLENKIIKLKVKISQLKKKVRAERSQAYRLRKKVEGLSVDSIMEDLLKDETDSVKTFVNMQLAHNNRQQWRTAEKELALLLYERSPRAYKFMRDGLKFHLPSVRIIQQSWLKSEAKGDNSCSSSEEVVTENQDNDP